MARKKQMKMVPVVNGQVISPPFPWSEHWSVDRRIPIALVLALFMQTCGFVWWAAQASLRLTEVERVVAAVSATTAPIDIRLARVEEKIGFLQNSMDEIKRLVLAQTTPIPASRAPLVR